jgi:lysozyme family protein
MTMSSNKGDEITIDKMLDTILKHEGGFVNHPNDRGGATNFGVTIREYGEWLGRPSTVQDVRNMKREEARDIFRKKYYTKPGIDQLMPVPLQPVVFDACVLYGPARAIIFLQKIVNEFGTVAKKGEWKTSMDGVLGPHTRRLVKEICDEYSWEAVNNAYVEERIRFCEAIVRNRPNQKVFLRGWTRRANSFRKTIPTATPKV